jgi:hypothetical protein
MSKIKAECTCGDGPDVLLIDDGEPCMLYEAPTKLNKAKYGYVERCSTCLSSDEAKKLANELLMAANRADELNSY